MLRVISLLLALALATIGAGTLAPSSTLEASSHSAVRSFSQPWATPGGRLVVTIAATNYGGFGQVEETLPQGFSYTGSSLSEGSVTVDGQTVSFVLLGDQSFTYTVEVPDDEGTYAFSGVLKDANRDERVVGGASQVLVGQEPTATPTLEPTPTPVPTLEPIATAVPEPSETPTVEPTAIPTATQAPTATMAPAAAAATALPETSDTGDSQETSGFGVFGVAVGGVLLVVAGFLAGYWAGRRKTP